MQQNTTPTIKYEIHAVGGIEQAQQETGTADGQDAQTAPPARL